MHRVPTTINPPSASNQSDLARLSVHCFCLVVAAILFIANSTAADDDQALDQFLTRLGLTDLRLTNMERILSRENAADKRAALARSLADGYAEELIAAADEPERFVKLKMRAEKLLAAFPEART